MNKISAYTVVFICFLIVSETYSQEIKSFTLKDAQEYAIMNNSTVKNARLDKIGAKRKVWQTTSIGLPHFNIKSTYTYLPTIPEVDFAVPYLINPSDSLGNNADMINMGYASQPIPLGVKNSTTTDFTLSQLIFNGPYIVGLTARKTFLTLADQTIEKSEIEVKELVTNTYYMILIAEENKAILDSSYKNISKTLFELKALLKEGFIEETDVDQLQLTLTNIGNTKKALDKQIELAYYLLKFQMGMNNQDKITLADDLSNIVEQINVEAMLSEEFDYTNNINYQMLVTQGKLAKQNLKLEKTSVLPTIAAFYNHQEISQAADFNFSMPDIIGVNVDIPIFSSGQRWAKISAASIELEKFENLQEQAIQGMLLEEQQARISLITANDKYISEKKNMELAQKIYNKTLIKYKEGLSSSMDLTQANGQFLTAQANYFSALNELLLAKNKLDKILSKL